MNAKGKGSPHMVKLRVMAFGRKRLLTWRLFWRFKRTKEAREGKEKDTGAKKIYIWRFRKKCENCGGREYEARTTHSLHHAHKKRATRTVLTGEISIPDDVSTLFDLVLL